MNPQTLGIYYSAIRKCGGKLYSIGPFAKYVDHVATLFKKIVIIAPTTDSDRFDLTYEIKSRNARLLELPYFSTALESIKKRKEIVKRLESSISEYDILWTKYPAQYGDALCRAALKAGKKVFVQIVGDPLDAVRNTNKYGGFLRYAAIGYARYKEKKMMEILRSVPVFANGGVLYEKFSRNGSAKNLHLVVSSTLVEEDYHQRQDTCLGPKIRILYIGYLQQRKGLVYLIKAMEEIRKRHRNAELALIGDGEEKRNLERLAGELSLSGSISFPGWISMGAALNRAYREADIFVFPTVAGEGTPRAILGAMANSLPVIATKTAGIPDVVKDGENGILVEPKSPGAIADAVATMIEDGERRKRYIENGYQTARRHSMDGFLSGMIKTAIEFYDH